AIEVEILHQPLQIGVRRLQYLRNPMRQLDVRISTQLAEDRRTLESLVGDAVELAKSGAATDLSHVRFPVRDRAASASSTRSSAGVPRVRSPSQLDQPSRPVSPNVVTGTSSASSPSRTSHAYSKPT